MLAVARRALLDAADELRLPRVRTAAPTRREPSRTVRAPRHLDLAVLAIELGQAMEAIAAEYVAKARETDGVTWEQVGEVFGTTMQSAHARFRAHS
jgi:hypothetical protein